MSVAQSGENHPFFGKHHTAKTKATIVSKLKGKKRKPFSAEHKAKISANHADVSGEKNPNYGKPRPPETRAKISAANKGKPSPLKGKKRPPEVVAKIKATWARKKLEKQNNQ